MTPDLPTFASRLRYARELRGLGSRELAALATFDDGSHLSPNAVYALETREHNDPRVSTVGVLADALKVPRPWLAWGDGPVPRK